MAILPDSLDTYIDQLIESVQGLFPSRERSGAPSPSPTSPGSEDVISSPARYTAPIHGEWHSSGGFDPVSMRPNGRKGHLGVDMRVPGGTPVYPLANGIVSNVGTDPLGGNVVNIKHDNGVRTYYAHLGTVQAQKGDKVTTNTIIGTVGNTGNARTTVHHLHFQVWKDNQIQNPDKYFTVPPYTNLSAEEKRQGPWLSPQAKEEAQAFNMQEHISSRRLAFSKNVDRLLKLAHVYCKLSKY